MDGDGAAHGTANKELALQSMGRVLWRPVLDIDRADKNWTVGIDEKAGSKACKARGSKSEPCQPASRFALMCVNEAT